MTFTVSGDDLATALTFPPPGPPVTRERSFGSCLSFAAVLDEHDTPRTVGLLHGVQTHAPGCVIPTPSQSRHGDGQVAHLFEALERELSRRNCDNTLRLTATWLSDHGYDIASIYLWLQRLGGYCDCEVLLNVEPKVFETGS